MRHPKGLLGPRRQRLPVVESEALDDQGSMLFPKYQTRRRVIAGLAVATGYVLFGLALLLVTRVAHATFERGKRNVVSSQIPPTLPSPLPTLP